jgi:AraC-like DNA-binding protein
VSEHAAYFRPGSLGGVEALHARFVKHAYVPHSHPTWTVAVVQHGAARFEVDATRQRADRGELFVLEPEAVHTGMAAVPEGWAYKRFPRAGRTRFCISIRRSCTSGTSATAPPLGLRAGWSSGTGRWEMLSGAETAARVAAQCGFADQAHLTRTFKRAVGDTPACYAAAHA